MTIKAVVFDAGGVLEKVRDDLWPGLWISRWEGLMGLPAEHVATLFAAEPSGHAGTGELSEAEMRARFAAALGLDEGLADQMMAEMWDHYCGDLDVALRDFAASLRPRFATAILSNSADGARREEERRYGFSRLVDVVIYSHEVGVAKPDPAIFKLTEELLGTSGHEIVLLDDSADNVRAARECGWQAVLHRDTPTSIRELTAILEPRQPSQADLRRATRQGGTAGGGRPAFRATARNRRQATASRPGTRE